jgi:putative membrane protein
METGKEDQRPAKGTQTVSLAEERTRLALKRTVLAADRTLLAWIRTSLSLMTFGFSFYKFFQYLGQSGIAGAMEPAGPRRFGVALVTLATVLLASQTLQYYQLLRRLSVAAHEKTPMTASLVAGVAVTLLGILAFINILFHVGFF